MSLRRPLPVLCALLLSSIALGQDHSVHVPMRDGTRLAVDVYLPESGADADGGYPALLELTRYWRARENPRTGRPLPSLRGVDRAFLAAGYALVKVDVRGTGASFGTRGTEYGRKEVRDGYDVVAWVVAQPWSSGAVGAYGTSYTGTTAELLAATEHPAVKAVVPGWSDFDAYRSPVRPYGLHASALMDQWGRLVALLDANASEEIGASVRRVQADDGGELVWEAVDEHAENLDVAQAVRRAEFRDQGFGEDTYAQVSSLYWKEAIERSRVPMLVFASWLDAGTAEGALQRFQYYTNPQWVVILSSAHGGFSHASPFVVGGQPRPPGMPVAEQFALRVAFFDHFLRGAENDVPKWPRVRYENMGAEELLASEAWPPAGAEPRRFHLVDDLLRSEANAPAKPSSGKRTYDVDFDVTTGATNRWGTQLGGPVLGLNDRGEMDERMLVWTSEPLEADLQVTGTPFVQLRFTADREDCAVLCYLEDVAPDGRSRYVTEGGIRAIDRKLGKNPDLPEELPFHSFNEADAQPLVPGEEVELVFRLQPTSVRFAAGHRIRLALAGADAETFTRVPASGDVTFEVSWSGDAPSVLTLPVVEDRAQ